MGMNIYSYAKNDINRKLNISVAFFVRFEKMYMYIYIIVECIFFFFIDLYIFLKLKMLVSFRMFV